DDTIATFRTENLGSLISNKIYYKWRIINYRNWKNPEKKTLNLFDVFQAKTDPVMFLSKVTVVLDKPADQIDLSEFIRNANLIQSLDDMVTQSVIGANDLEIYKVKNQEYRKKPGYHWCDDSNHTLCLNSEFVLPKVYKIGLAAYWATSGYLT